MKHLLKSITIILSILFLFVPKAFSVSWDLLCNDWTNRNNDPFCLSNAKEFNPANWLDLIDLLSNSINFLLTFVALIATILWIYGWFLMLTAANDDEKVKKWKKIIIFAVIWIIVIFLAYPLTKIIFWESWEPDSWLFEATWDYTNP